MSKSWDAIVIGAGLGGLTAAARLIKEGLRVLVVEQDPHPGGTAYVYLRKGFNLPMGPLGFSNPTIVQAILKEVGIKERLDLKRVYYQLRAFGLEAPLSLPYPEMVRELASLFPEEEEGIERFFDDIQKASRLLEGPDEDQGGAADGIMTASAADYLNGLIDDRRLRRILGSMGSREPYSGLPLLAAMWGLLCEKGIHYPARGMRYLCDLLAKPLAVKTGPGGLMLSTRVSEIAVNDGKAGGVFLSDGTRLEADAVISNADYKSTFLYLVEPHDVPGEFLAAVSEARQTSSNLQVCLGLDASRVDLSAFGEASRLIHRRGDDVAAPGAVPEPAWNEREVNPSDLASEELEVTLISADDPALAPEGGAVLVIRVAADYNHFTRFRPERGERTPEYLAYKTRLGEALANEASKLVPGLEDAILVMDVATPLTFEERGGRSEGAVAGWSWNYGEGFNRARELIRTPIESLYMTGYQAYSMLSLGGVPTAMKSGLMAARYLLEGKGPTGELLIP